MLTPEQAKELRQVHWINDHEAHSLAAIALLPDTPLNKGIQSAFEKVLAKRYSYIPTVRLTLRAVGYHYFSRRADGLPFEGSLLPNEHVERQATNESRYAHHIAECALLVMTSAQRLMIFNAIFPTIGRHIEQLWQFIATTPYEYRYHVRKPFRQRDDSAYDSKRLYLLDELYANLSGFHDDIDWLAENTPYVLSPYRADVMGYLFAAVIDRDAEQGEAVLQTLLRTASNGTMGRHVVRALLLCSRIEAWAMVEKLLLSAQREEGLRKTILDVMTEAHPQAFRHLLHVLINNNMVRFAAVAGAVNGWLNLSLALEDTHHITQMLRGCLTMLDNPPLREEALRIGTQLDLWLALWALASEDVETTQGEITRLLDDLDRDRRFAAARMMLELGQQANNANALKAMHDSDLAIAMCGFMCINTYFDDGTLFDKLEALIARLPELEIVGGHSVHGWHLIAMSKAHVAYRLFDVLRERSPRLMLPYLMLLGDHGRIRLVKMLVEAGDTAPDVLDMLVGMVSEPKRAVRETAMKLLMEKLPVTPDIARNLESLMGRKAAELRRGVIWLLLKQSDADALASAERMLLGGSVEMRSAGLEVLAMLKDAGRNVCDFAARAEAYRARHRKLQAAEEVLLNKLAAAEPVTWTLENALGFIDPARRSKPVPPQRRDVMIETPATHPLLLSLDALVKEYATKIITRTYPNGNTREGTLVDMNIIERYASFAGQEENVAFGAVWRQWAETRPPELRDADGFEFLRASALLRQDGHEKRWYARQRKMQPSPLGVIYIDLCASVLSWLTWLYPAEGTIEFLFDCAETQFASVPPEIMGGVVRWTGTSPYDWRRSMDDVFEQDYRYFWHQLHSYRQLLPSSWTNAHEVRSWGLARWLDEPAPGISRFPPPLESLIRAHRIGAATDEDLYDQLVATVHGDGRWSHLPNLASKEFAKALADPDSTHPHKYPPLITAMERCRDRVLEIELARGENTTLVTTFANGISYIPGIAWLVRILQALGKQSLERKSGRYSSRNNSYDRSDVLSHLLRSTYPLPDETPADFARAVKAAKISDKHLVAAAMSATHWALYIEYTLKWRGLVDGIWWLYAHTRDQDSFRGPQGADRFAQEIQPRTPLTVQELLYGAVDVDWFARVYKTLGAERWEALYDAAKYTSSGTGHTRARLFADAMLGKLDEGALVKRMLEKRYQDAARALGLVPLAKKGRKEVLLKRYQHFQAFLRLGKKSGAMRRENEKLAVQVGMENLARTAGYVDPQRLTWAMETASVADIQDGTVMVEHGDLKATLSFDVVGKAQLEVRKNGKLLKAPPPALKKHPPFMELRERKTQLEQQYSRMRASLEEAMCREDVFRAEELRDLLAHPVLAPMLEQLVFVGDNIAGYLVEGGRALIRHDGTMQTLTPAMMLRIAHPIDLLRGGEWHLWQRDCFVVERIQPFKQVFRELYTLTDAERADGDRSQRYSGHQVQPRQAHALFGARGWITHEYGDAVKVFHTRGISANIGFGGYFNVYAVEDTQIYDVAFHKVGEWKSLRLEEVPPILFSEVMRDLDLVVSVAHRGGVDPEATASTVEMRSMLLRETCTLLGMTNVELQSKHALIQGELGHYTVHLGSGVVHKQPGGSLCIIPVQAQQRGRLFLPFADDDPRTAEVVSKVVLLARDAQIKDPTILEQIYARVG